MIRLLLAEDQAMVRGALATLLSLEPDLEVVAQVDRGDAVLDAVRRTHPDVAVLDIEMPGQDGLAAAAELTAAGEPCRVLIVTTFGRSGYLRRALAAGAAGFLLKDAPATHLAASIRRVHAGERVVDPGLATAALSEGESPLTAREHRVLEAMQKLGARNRAEAVRVAEDKGRL
jgi:two-component system response regulator DesR